MMITKEQIEKNSRKIAIVLETAEESVKDWGDAAKAVAYETIMRIISEERSGE